MYSFSHHIKELKVMTWTTEKIKQLKKLWQKGKSTVEIGKELGISKNAVVGKVHRLELEARPSPIKKIPSSSVVSKKLQQVKGKKFVTLMDLKINSCRWPIGDPKDEDFHFCGADVVTGKPYCSEHCKIAYTSLKELTLQNAKAKKEKEELMRNKETSKKSDEYDPSSKEKATKTISKKDAGVKKKDKK